MAAAPARSQLLERDHRYVTERLSYCAISRHSSGSDNANATVLAAAAATEQRNCECEMWQSRFPNSARSGINFAR